MESKVMSNLGQNKSNIDVNTRIDFKLEGWPASITLISFFMMGILMYGIQTWEKCIEHKNI